MQTIEYILESDPVGSPLFAHILINIGFRPQRDSLSLPLHHGWLSPIVSPLSVLSNSEMDNTHRRTTSRQIDNHNGHLFMTAIQFIALIYPCNCNSLFFLLINFILIADMERVSAPEWPHLNVLHIEM